MKIKSKIYYVIIFFIIICGHYHFYDLAREIKNKSNGKYGFDRIYFKK